MKKSLFTILGAGFVLLSCASGPSAPSSPSAKPAELGESTLFEGFEDGAQWYAVAGGWKDGNQSTEAQVIEGHATEGNHALSASYRFVNDPAKKGASWFTEDIVKKNWAGVRAVLVDIDNTTGKDLELDLAVCTGDAWDWHETEVVRVPSGRQKNVSFDLTNLKSNLSQWAWGAPLANPKSVQRVVLQVINGPAQGDTAMLYFDNLRLVK